MRSLVIAEHSAGQLTAGTRSAVTAALALGARRICWSWVERMRRKWRVKLRSSKA